MLNIRKVTGTTLAGLATLGVTNTAVADPTPDQTYVIPAAIPVLDVEKVATWQNTKFAMFIHWGVYSHYAGWYKG